MAAEQLSRRHMCGTALASWCAGVVPALRAQEQNEPPSLGNLFGPIESYARTLKPQYSYLNDRFKDLETWKSEARRVYAQKLLYHPEPQTVSAQVTAKKRRNGYVQEDLLLKTTPFTEAPAVLLLPDKPLKTRPAVVALHDHGGFYYYGKEKLIENEQEAPVLTAFKKKLYDGFSYASELARAGYAVLTIDAFYFGGRKLDPATLPAGKASSLQGLAAGSDAYITAANKLAGSYEHLTAKTIFLSGATWPGMIVWDDMRSVDYLLTRPEVNPDRIGCVGLSLGGVRAAQLGGMHPKVRSTVVCCFMASFRPMLRNDVEHHTWMLYVPGTFELLDLPDIAAMTAPNWLLVQYGKRDTLFSAASKAASAADLKALFAKAKCPDHVKPVFWDAPHMFSKGMQEEALAWFGRTLA